MNGELNGALRALENFAPYGNLGEVHELLDQSHWFSTRGGLTDARLERFLRVMRERKPAAADRLRQLQAEAERMDRAAKLMDRAAKAKASSGGASLVLLAGESIRPEPVRWLCDGWLAQGKLHSLAGALVRGKRPWRLHWRRP